jgi:hypothetical protein
MTIQCDFLTAGQGILTEWVMKRTLISFLLVFFTPHIIYHFAKRYLAYRVGRYKVIQRTAF